MSFCCFHLNKLTILSAFLNLSIRQWISQSKCDNVASELEAHYAREINKFGSVTLVLLPLKYEIDDSITVTVVLLEGGGALLYVYGRDIGLQVRQKPTGKVQVYGISAHSLHFCISCCLVWRILEEYNISLLYVVLYSQPPCSAACTERLPLIPQQ